jgi:hypothetical protein
VVLSRVLFAGLNFWLVGLKFNAESLKSKEKTITSALGEEFWKP